MHLAFDAKRLFTNFTGLGNYSRTLLRNLADNYSEPAYFLYTPRIVRNDETQFFASSPGFVVRTPPSWRSLLWRSRGILRDLQRDRIDLYHGLSHEIPVGIARTDIKSVVTIHDLIFRHYPEQYGWMDRRIYDFKFRYACEHADRIVAISESTRADIVQFYGIDPGRISVIYQSCDERFFQQRSDKSKRRIREKYQLPDHYFLYVGSLIERKNLLGCVQAMAVLKPSERMPLVIVGGGRGSYRKQVMAEAGRLGLQHMLHWVKPDFDDLPVLYQMAHVFLYPSFYEGFGIPVIEALFSGVPVVTSNVSSLPEAAGPDSCLVDPRDPGAIAEGIRMAAQDTERRHNMIQAGYRYAQRFRPEPVTEQMMRLYRRVLD